jgi:hypothetical protein
MKYFFPACLFLAFFSSVEKVTAQNTAKDGRTIQVSARAVIEANLYLLTIRDLDLINPPVEDSRIFVSPQTSPFAGLFRIQGNPKASLRVTYLISESIQEAGGNGGVVTSRYVLSGFERDNQYQSILFSPTGEFNLRLGEDGFYYLWVGTELDLSQALPGEYFSEFIIEMEYT